MTSGYNDMIVQGDGVRWRRTGLTRADGSVPPDDWCLVHPVLGPIARIYKVVGGPRDKQWFWAVQVDGQGRPWNGGTGYCEIGKEAKEVVEARMPKTTDGSAPGECWFRWEFT